MSFSVNEVMEQAYEQEYLWAVRQAGLKDAKPWLELTEEQRENVRKAYHSYRKKMNAFGESLRKK